MNYFQGTSIRVIMMIIIGGGRIIRPNPDFVYDKFKVPHHHVLRAVGILDSPLDLHYLKDYKYLTARSSWDKERLSYLRKEVHVVPCNYNALGGSCYSENL